MLEQEPFNDCIQSLVYAEADVVLLDDVLSAVDRNVKTIMLVGSGGNGKSHLTNELKSVLESNGYVIYSPDTSYSWKEADVFLENMNTVEKKVVHLLFDPYLEWCLGPPVDVTMVMMDGIRW